jgi:carbon monoxide dehydrogenase subunit G
MVHRIPLFIAALFAILSGTVGTLFAEDTVFYTFLTGQGRYHFEGGFYIKADPQVVWDVLTDFDHYSKYISNMHCRIRHQDADGLLVDQTVGGGFLFIQENIRSRLYVQEAPMVSLTFTGVDHKTFDSYGGGWKIATPSPDGRVKVTYDVEVERGKKTPGFLTNDLFCGSQGDLLAEMKKEILKRQAKVEKDRVKIVKEASNQP